MALSSGTRLGPYEIVSPLGAGGMGEVYRAHDAKLGRDVAIKILPEVFAADPERRGRFEREARTLAALNHPHIAQIYGYEESGATLALVMELVDGETLDARLKARAPSGCPLDEAIAIARQIADGLEAAHEQGIVHRDLKPANIKIRDDGTVKILDFGLAKAFDPAASTGDAAMNSPTLTAHATVAGVILGTAAYMAPEQARGKAVDRRADIWAFGAVLYEMLAGKRAFEGDEISDTLASVLKEDPDWTALPPDIPVPLRRVLRRCLEKDPRKRLSAIGDARLDLDEREDVRRVDGPAQTRLRMLWIVATAVTSMIAGGAAATWLVRASLGSSPEPLLTRFSIAPPENTTLYPDSTSAVISPDGRTIVMVTGDSGGTASRGDYTGLWVRSIDAVNARPLAGTAGAFMPFWSPDSRQIAFFTLENKLKKITLSTGRIEEICEAVDGRGGAWSQEGVILFGGIGGPLLRVPAAGGTLQPATTLDAARGETGHRFPTFLPDGRHFLYAAVPVRSAAYNIFVGSLDESTQDLLLSAQAAPVFSNAGYLLFVRKGNVVAQRFDAQQRTLSGEPVALADASAAVGFQYFAGYPLSVSTTNTLAYLENLPNATLSWVDQSGNQTSRVAVPAGGYNFVNLTRDGTRAVVVKWTSPTVSDLWISELERGGTARLPISGQGLITTVVWSPDGERVAFGNSPDGSGDIYLKSTITGNSEELLYRSKALTNQPVSWSADGQFLAFQEIDPKTRWDLWVLSTRGDRKPTPYARTASNETGGRISPDGKWMAYLSDETNRNQVYVQAFPTPGRKHQVTSGGGSGVWWRGDGKQLLIVTETEILLADVLAGSDFSTGTPRIVGRLPKGVVTLDVTTDLRRLLLIVNEGGASGRSVTVVQNWTAALAR